MSAAEPPPDAPAPPAGPVWVGPAAGLAAALLVLLAAQGGPLAAPGALAGHALAAGVLAAMAVEGLILRRQCRAIRRLGESPSDGGWPGAALQACLAQVRATPSLTDRHEILRVYRAR